MAYKRFQNTVTESKAMLPLSAAVAAASCYQVGLVQQGLWMQLVCLAVAVVLLIELNSTHQLIRVVSQSTASVFLLLVSTAVFLFPYIQAAIMQLCMVAVYFMLFHCRQHDESPGWTFYGFFCLGLASMVFVQVLYYVPVLWVLMATCIRALNAKTFWASIIGIVAPYWLGGPLIVYFLGTEMAVEHFQQLWTFAPLGDYSMIGEHEWVAIGWTTFLAIVGIIHYWSHGYQDKTRTRLLHEVFITMCLFTIAFIALQPQHYRLLLPILMVNTCPLIAHYLTLTHTWLTNISFYFIIIVTLAIIVYNVWMPSLNFLSAMATQACLYLP